jgi:hypothetical protein
LRRRLRLWAEALGTNPSSWMGANTRSRVAALTSLEPWMTRDTLAMETPARCATS